MLWPPKEETNKQYIVYIDIGNKWLVIFYKCEITIAICREFVFLITDDRKYISAVQL